MKASYRWVPALSLIWIAGGFVLTRIRPGQIPAEGPWWLLVGYALLGAVSGAILVSLVQQAPDRTRKLMLALAYLLVSPVAAFSGLLGPVGISRPWVTPLTTAVYGLIPIGIALGFTRWIGEGLDKP